MIHTLSLSLKRHVRAKRVWQGPQKHTCLITVAAFIRSQRRWGSANHFLRWRRATCLVSTSDNIQCAYIIIIYVSSSRVPVEKISVATPMKASETMLSMATEMLSCRATFLYKLGCILSSSSPTKQTHKKKKKKKRAMHQKSAREITVNVNERDRNTNTDHTNYHIVQPFSWCRVFILLESCQDVKAHHVLLCWHLLKKRRRGSWAAVFTPLMLIIA